MPKTFEQAGIRMMYPDNWQPVETEAEDATLLTLELPSGGFFSIDHAEDDEQADHIIEQTATTIRSEYEDVEQSAYRTEESAGSGSATHAPRPLSGMEMRFYYLDLLILCRVVLVPRDQGYLVVTMQAESREFDEREKAFDAMLMQLAG